MQEADEQARLGVVLSHHIFELQAVGGISRYIVELDRALKGIGISSTLRRGASRNTSLEHLPRGFADALRARGYPRAVRRRRAERLERRGCTASDVFHASYYDAKLPSNCAAAVTVYDMIHETERLDASERWVVEAKRNWVARADAVFVISDAVRDEVLEILSPPEEKVFVTPLAVRASDAVVAPDDGRPYLLYVGQRHARYKNFIPMVRALADARILGDLKLTCVGGGPFSNEERRAIDGCGVGPHIVQRSASDAELAGLYRHATTTVVPSKREGFGLPVLEAMAAGCPVACSAIPVLREVAGDMAEYFDPSQVTDMAAVIFRAVHDPARRAAMKHGGFVRASSFSWEATARSTAVGYRFAMTRPVSGR
ncbi:MAG: glycosyltransferase family 1 protein [Chloroflexota bacterium]